MTSTELQSIKVQIYHELIGNHTFQFSPKTHTSDLRTHIQDNSPLYIYDNFHLQLNSQRLPQCNQISQIFKGDVRLQVVFDSYDQYSSRYHEDKVRKILLNPIHWIIINYSDYPSKSNEEERQEPFVPKLQELFVNPFSSTFLNLPQKKESDLGNIINSSGFNPPPLYRKLLGDLYYLHLKTPQDIDFHVTATVEGFLVNQSVQGNFNPNPHHKYSTCLSLIDLLFQISPKFKLKFQEVQKTTKISEAERWNDEQKLGSNGKIWMAEGRAWRRMKTWNNDNYQYKQRNDLAMVKDWMQIFQYQLASPAETLNEKIGKQKLRFRIYQQFSQSVKECVIKIFSGTIEPLTRAAKMQRQTYYYSGLLIYFVQDQLSEDHSDDSLPSGYASDKQLQMLGLIQQINIENVYLSRLAVIHYRGFKIVARTIPNFLVSNKDNNIELKSIFEQCKLSDNDDVLVAALRKICKNIGVQSQNIVAGKNGQKLVCVNPQLATCISSDNKRFILETKSFAPKDLNFHKNETDECYLRSQIMTIYNKRLKCPILYNPNIGSRHKLANIQKYKEQNKKLQSVAKFAKEIMVSSLIDSFDGDMRKYLSDSHQIMQVLHKFGLSFRYLSIICKKALEKQANHVYTMMQRTILVISLQTLFSKALKLTPLFLHKVVIKHLLNCLFGNHQANGKDIRENKYEEETEYNNGKKGKKKKNKENQTCFEINFGKVQEKYCHIKCNDFWEELKGIALSKFKHSLLEKSEYFQYQFSKIAILRDLCLCLGIILEKKDYFSQQKHQFIAENIINILPKVDTIVNEPKQLNQFIEQGDKQSNKFQIEQALEAYNKAVQYVFTYYGEAHQKLGTIYKKFSHLHFKIGDIQSALVFAVNSYDICQNFLGFDHVETIEAMMMIGIYHFGRKKFDLAEYYLLKAIFTAQLAYSECYPEVIVMYMNLSTVYQSQRKFPDAIMSLFKALNISIKVYGNNNLNTAIIYSALASLHYDIPDIEQAIKYQEKSINILEILLGKQDQRVLEAKSIFDGYKNIQSSKKVRETHEKQQKNIFGLPALGKLNAKPPFFDMRQRATDFAWKKPKKLKYFF